MAEDASLSRSRRILKSITSILSLMISTLPPPPLLPVVNTDALPIAQNLQNLELGKLAFTLAITATLALIFSQKFAAAVAHNIVVVGFMAACAAVWNGMLFGITSLQLMGINLILVCLYSLVASFLPSSFSWACCLLGVLCLMPLCSTLLSILNQLAS